MVHNLYKACKAPNPHRARVVDKKGTHATSNEQALIMMNNNDKGDSHASLRIGDDSNSHCLTDYVQELSADRTVWPIEDVEDHTMDQIVFCQLKKCVSRLNNRGNT